MNRLGRPKINEEERVGTSVTFPKSLYEELQRVTKKLEIGRNKIVERAVEKYLEELRSRDPLP